MKEVYYYIGLIIFWLSACIGTILLIGYLIKIITNELGRRFNTIWIIVEYAHYRAKFKEWVKDQKRHPKLIEQEEIEYGHYDGKRYPVGTRLTSLENGEIIEASPDTPEDRIVCIVEPDKE